MSGIQHVKRLDYSLQSCIVVDVDGHAAVLALLGGDDDDTVGGTATVDRSRGGILQDLDGLDIGRVQGVQVLVGGDTIDDIQGVTSVDGAHTAHTDGGTATTGSGIGHDVHTRELALHRVEHVGVAVADRAFHVHHSHGTGQVSLALYLITGHHKFLELDGVVLEGDGHTILGGNLHLFITDVGYHQYGSGIYLDDEVTIKVGHCTVAGTFLNHSGADDGLSSLVNDGACDFCLSIH